ncbi:MAG: hypothetical protein N2323_02915 [candidate division WOR-3 bacterium]|nr:hypothetical protein [candidate division WOR-3 bacterium]MCX7836899.1 hypothetical protein [candidate division WOR-3 bacterium]
MRNLKRMVKKYYFSFGCEYPKSTYKYYYQMKKLLKYEEDLKKILKDYFIPETFYTGYLNFLRRVYKLIKKRRLSEIESLIKREILRNKLKEEVLKELYFLLLKDK